jgi:Flp pilus assembly protein TadG
MMDASKGHPPDRQPRARDRCRVRRRLRAFRRDEDGVAAVEFGMVAIPFFALLFAILETALVFWTTQVLETAVADAARTIYTGQFQTANPGASADIGTKFKVKVCDKVQPLIACTAESGTVRVDVRVVTSDIPPVIKDGAIDPAAFGYQETKPNDLVLVRVAVEYPVFVSMLSPNQDNPANGKRLIMGSATFRNEPF